MNEFDMESYVDRRLLEIADLKERVLYKEIVGDILKKVYFEKADLVQAQVFKTSLKDIDLSNSFIDGIVVSLEDIKGAIINEYQAINLISLMGVKIKE